MAVAERDQALHVLVDHEHRQSGVAQLREARARSPGAPAAPGPRSPRRGSAGAGWSPARGRSRASAARRRRAALPTWRAALAAARERESSSARRRLQALAPLAATRAARRRVRCSSTLRFGKTCRPSGTSATPRARDPVRRPGLRSRAPAKAIAAAPSAACRPMIVRTSVVLPMPLRPSTPTISPGADREVDAEQHLGCRRSRHAEAAHVEQRAASSIASAGASAVARRGRRRSRRVARAPLPARRSR